MIHPTERVQLAGRRWANIDVEMADLVRECWRLGIETQGCCQGRAPDLADVLVNGRQAGYAYISFDVESAGLFVESLSDPPDGWNTHDPSVFEARMFGLTIAPPFWFWRAHPNVWEPGLFSIHANFPSSDIPEIQARLAALPTP